MTARLFVVVAIGVLVNLVLLAARAEGIPLAPPEDPQAQQIEAAARLAEQQPAVWPQCKRVNERVCVSLDLWVHMGSPEPKEDR